jgi:hypothetical protein
MYLKNIVASYEDFEEYFFAMLDDAEIGVKSVVVGSIQDAETIQKNAASEIYPMLFVHIPSFESYNSGGNMNRFDSDFLVLMRNSDDNVERRKSFNKTRNVVLNIQKRFERDAQNGMFEFGGRLQAEPKTNLTFGKCLGWFVGFELATPGVGVDSDYRV